MGRQDKKEKAKELTSQEKFALIAKQFNIVIDLETIEKEKNLPKQIELNLEHTKISTDKRKARSPYNFIPLNEKIVEYKKAPENDFFHTKDEYSNTGYVELEIETITPLYIRDSYSMDEINKKKSNDKFINSDFYSPTKKYAIPGSSMRGMIRTLVEILSFSKIGYVGDKYLYFRTMADMCHSVKDNYIDKMSSKAEGEKKGQYKMSCGILYKNGLNYYITHVSDNPKEIKKVISKKEIQNYQTHKYFEFNDKFIVVAGDAPPKKNRDGKLVYKENDWVINKKSKTEKDILIPKEDVESYLDDFMRDSKIPNLISDTKTYPDGVPCFYVKWKDSKNKERVSFGYNPMFRLSYEKSIFDHIPEDHKNKDILDITSAIFGIESEFATRVFFEDSFLNENQTDIIMEEKIPQILSGAKPTTFQHYLTQNTDDVRNLSHYNSTDSAIRGNKLYFHKSGQNWEEKNVIKNDNVHTKIKAIKPNKKFSGKIRFENLSNIELGALLQALSLPTNCFHKIGMGKPLGLGSIKITPKLYLSNRIERYTSLFSEFENKNECKIDDKINIFCNFIKKELKINEKSDFWKIPRIKELNVMLDFKNGIELEKNDKTRYMTIGAKGLNEFKERPVLPLPADML